MCHVSYVKIQFVILMSGRKVNLDIPHERYCVWISLRNILNFPPEYLRF